jgi:zinc protease
MTLRKLQAATLAMLLTVSVAAAAAGPTADLGGEIRTKTLKNGLKVIVWPDHDIPNVAMYNWVRAGARNERPGITGLSHFFEHMMFNGSQKYGPGEFDRVMEANGGANNAFTSSDVTVYQDWFPRTALEVIFDLEGDRIANLKFDEEVIESERGVVHSERRLRVDNSNMGLLYEQAQATAFVAHPYQFPVIGWPSDIAAWSLEDLVSYFKTYYAPNNGNLIVVGDVTPEEIFDLAEKYLEPIPSQDPPEPVRTVEPEQLGERRFVIEKEAQVPLIVMAYHIGAADDPEAPALRLLLSILSDGDSSRLHQRLVEQEQVAISVGSFQDGGFDPGLAWFRATLSEATDPATAERIIDEELQKVVKNGITDAELQKAKNIFLSDFWRNMKTINGKAYALGEYEVFHGDYRKLFEAPAIYDAVTKDQLQQVAAKVLRRTNRTVGVLKPIVAETTTAERQEARR